MTTPKTLILALGNPGEEYENTYHSAGMIALPAIMEWFVDDDYIPAWKTHKKLFTYAGYGDVIFAKSMTFMNESGRAAAEALKKFKISPDHLVVLHDESDVPVGDYKLSFDRSSGGQKGVQSIIDHIGTQAFWRVRIGIRPARERIRQKAGSFVLANVKPADAKIFKKVFEDAARDLIQKLQDIKKS